MKRDEKEIADKMIALLSPNDTLHGSSEAERKEIP